MRVSPIGNVLAPIVPPAADDAFAFMAVWREPAGSDDMMERAVCKSAATAVRSSLRQVPKSFMRSVKNRRPSCLAPGQRSPSGRLRQRWAGGLELRLAGEDPAGGKVLGRAVQAPEQFEEFARHGHHGLLSSWTLVAAFVRELLYATLSETSANITLMKTFNTKLAIRVFSAIAVFDAIILVLDHVLPDRWLIIPWWSVNFAGYPLVHYFVDVLRSSPASITCLLVVVGLLSALLWSAVAGFVFRRRYAA